MQNHDNDSDTIKQLLKSEELIKKISPEFNELSLDLQDVMKQSNNPMFVAALLFKCAQLQERQNKILEGIDKKYDEIMFLVKTKQAEAPAVQDFEAAKGKFEVLAEQDEAIMKLAEEKGMIEAKAIQQALGYKGVNAACQRLNKLFREGRLVKKQAGKKVFYLPKF